MEENKIIKGIKINTMNIIMIVISVVLYVLLILASMQVSYRSDVMVDAMDDYISCEENASLVMDGSDYLTEQVRLYTVTQDITYLDAYFTEEYVTRRREKALERLEYFDFGEDAYDNLKAAVDNSNKLIEQEIYAMKLVSQAKEYDMSNYPDIQNCILADDDKTLNQAEMIDKARNIVFGSAYQSAKESIQKNTSQFIKCIVNDTMQREQDSVSDLQSTVVHQHIMVSILLLKDIFTFILIILLIAKPLRIYSKNIKEEKTLDMVGSYEFKNLAMTYNHIYELNAASKAMLSRQADLMRYQSEHDSLTEIINRRAFNRLTQLLKNDKKSMALMLIDVDTFKLVNDKHGHEVGDRVLKKVAKLLEESFRSSDYPARIGGDEFAVIVVGATIEMKSVISEKVNAMNMVLMNPIDDLPKASLSVGVAFSGSGFGDDLYTKADTALYKVKENGRCGCAFYEEQEYR